MALITTMLSTIIGGAETFTSITVTGLTASRAVVTDSNKTLASSATTATELGYVSGVTSAIQTQINAKLTGTAASQSDQETGSSTTAFVASGTQQYHPSANKAWVECGLTGNILASYNVTSVTDTGTGAITVNFTVNFSSVTYGAVLSVGGGSTVVRVPMANSYNASNFVGNCVDAGGTLSDPAGPNVWSVICCGDQ